MLLFPSGNLSTAQIVEQVVQAKRLLAADGDRTPLTNLVFMVCDPWFIWLGPLIFILSMFAIQKLSLILYPCPFIPREWESLCTTWRLSWPR